MMQFVIAKLTVFFLFLCLFILFRMFAMEDSVHILIVFAFQANSLHIVDDAGCRIVKSSLPKVGLPAVTEFISVLMCVDSNVCSEAGYQTEQAGVFFFFFFESLPNTTTACGLAVCFF